MIPKPSKKQSRYARNGAAVQRSRKVSAARTRQRYDVLAMLKRVEAIRSGSYKK